MSGAGRARAQAAAGLRDAGHQRHEGADALGTGRDRPEGGYKITVKSFLKKTQKLLKLKRVIFTNYELFLLTIYLDISSLALLYL